MNISRTAEWEKKKIYLKIFKYTYAGKYECIYAKYTTQVSQIFFNENEKISQTPKNIFLNITIVYRRTTLLIYIFSRTQQEH